MCTLECRNAPLSKQIPFVIVKCLAPCHDIYDSEKTSLIVFFKCSKWHIQTISPSCLTFTINPRYMCTEWYVSHIWKISQRPKYTSLLNNVCPWLPLSSLNGSMKGINISCTKKLFRSRQSYSQIPVYTSYYFSTILCLAILDRFLAVIHQIFSFFGKML